MEESTLTKFFQATHALRKSMESDEPLDHVEQLCFENHLALLHMTYIEWKLRNIPPNPPYWRCFPQQMDESLPSGAR